MSRNNRKRCSFYIVLVLIFLFTNTNCDLNREERVDQKKLYNKIAVLSHEEISSITIRFIKKYQLIEQKCIFKDSDVKKFLGFLKNADFTQAGGHNSRDYEFIIFIDYKNGNKDKFVGIVYSGYDFNINALYIYNHFYKIRNEYYHATETGLPVRVPELGKWMSEKCPIGKFEGP